MYVFHFAVSLENVITDVSDLEKNMEVVKRECEMRSKDRTCSQNLNILRDFLSNNEDKLKRLRADTKVAQDAFNECIEYFGESPRMTDANTFFSLLVRFTRSFKVSFVYLKNKYNQGCSTSILVLRSSRYFFF